jgi:hypothetical protein
VDRLPHTGKDSNCRIEAYPSIIHLGLARTAKRDDEPVNAKSDLADRYLSSVVTDFVKMLSTDRAEIASNLRKGALKPLHIEKNVPTWF